MERIVSCVEVNGVITASPDTLRVNPGDTIKWDNQLSDAYRATNFSPEDPQNPPLFGDTEIEIPAHSPSEPATVAANPNNGKSFEYHYSLVPVDPEKSTTDPVIVVESPTP